LLSADLTLETCLWLRGYRYRTGVHPWMLSNLTAALRARGRYKKSIDAAYAALRMNDDHTSPSHRVWIALHRITTNRPADAQRLIEFTPASALDPLDNFVRELVLVLLRYEHQEHRNRDTSYQTARKALHELSVKHIAQCQSRAGRMAAKRV